jgi:hypothetical protein
MSDDLKNADHGVDELCEKIEFLTKTLENSDIDDDECVLGHGEFDKLKLTLEDCRHFIDEVHREQVAARGLRAALAPPVRGFRRMSSSDQKEFREQLDDSVKVNRVDLEESEHSDLGNESSSTDSAEGASPRTQAAASAAAAAAAAAAATAALQAKAKQAKKWWNLTRRAAKTLTDAKSRISRIQELTDRINAHQSKLTFSMAMESLKQQKIALGESWRLALPCCAYSYRRERL